MMHGQRTARGSLIVRAVIALAVLSLLATACGGSKKSSGAKKSGGGAVGQVGTASDESGLANAGKPTRGGKLVYGLEGESSGGYCLPEAQLAIGGTTVARSIYDTLTVPDSKADYVPYLAKSIDPSPDYKTWTITLRPNIKFHDGSPLDATVVKNNLDAFRGKYPTRKPLLFVFTLGNIQGVTVKDPMTVEVTTVKPWTGFPGYLFSDARLGIMAQAQLDNKDHCDTEPIGTGPFKFVSWRVNDVLIVKKNPDYWRMAPDGKPFPYLDEVDFRPIPDTNQRLNALQGGDISAMHTSSAAKIGGPLKDLQSSGAINMYVTQKFAEVNYYMLNASKPPFDNEQMRRAVGMAFDRDKLNQIVSRGLPTIADGPFAPGNVGYLKDPGFPKFNPTEAKALVAEYVKGGGKAEIALFSSNDPEVLQGAELFKENMKAVGISVSIVPEEQAKVINDAIGGTFQAITWRLHPGGDPDIQYNWWYDGNPDPKVTGNPVNFGRINDPVIDQLLDQGRSEPDPAKRTKIYEDLNRQFAKKVWNVWTSYTVWAVAEGKNVHGVIGSKLPNGQDPMPGMSQSGNPVAGMWCTGGNCGSS